jgi:hypothetical protein
MIDKDNQPLTVDVVSDYLGNAMLALDEVSGTDNMDAADLVRVRVQLASSMMIADGLCNVAHALVLLGHAGAVSDNGTEIGAIEGLTMGIKEGLTDIADAIEGAK